jgi:type I restriction enzyme S subunit
MFEKYDTYKDSGVDWIGRIPSCWSILRAKNLFKFRKMINAKYQCDNVLSLTLRGVVNNNFDNPEGLIPKDYATYQIFNKNDLVFKLIDLENISTSRVGLVHEKGIMSPAYIRLECSENVNPQFAYYYFYNLYLQAVFNKLGAGVRSTLSQKDLLELPYFNVCQEQQTKIVNFLNTKILEIDQAIAIKEQQIALLNERKQIVIQKAVTQGLDPNVPMKDSGVEWIGPIPEHWEIKKLKYVLEERSERSRDGLEPLLMMSQIHGLVVRSEYSDKAEVAATTVGNKLVYHNDLVFNKLKAHLGVFFGSVHEFIGSVSPDYAVYKPVKYIEKSKFLELLFRNPLYIRQFILRSSGIVEGLIRLYTTELFDLKIAIPPNVEQKDILKFVEQQSVKFDEVIENYIQQIEKLKEYKTTLINDAVTGKIKVV